MNIRNFQQFLVLEGLVTQEQLDALHVSEETHQHQSLGELATHREWMTPEQVQSIHQSQLTVNQPFGILAVERGFLTEEQVEQLLETQRSKKHRYVEYLTQENLLNRDELESILERYEQYNRPTNLVGSEDSPQSVFINEFATALSTRIRRLCQSELKLTHGVHLNAPQAKELTTAVDLSMGDENYLVQLSTDRNFSTALIHGLSTMFFDHQKLFMGDTHYDLAESTLSFILHLLKSHSRHHEIVINKTTIGEPLVGGMTFYGVASTGFAVLTIKDLGE